MKLQLKNIGMIQKANINLDGLTVIAGENNTGKSTVGKLLFSIIKASSRYKEDLEENREAKIFTFIEKNYFQLRRRIDFSENLELRELFYPPKFKKDIEEKSLKAIDSRINIIKSMEEKSLFPSDESININNKYLAEIKSNLSELRKILLQEDNKQEAQKRAFKKVLMSEFKGKISSQNNIESLSKIKVSEGENEILSIEMINDDIKEFKIFDELYFSDATFIESPVVIQMSEAIDNARTYFEDIDKDDRVRRPNVPLHVKDLNDKLKISFYEDDFLEIADVFTNVDIKGLFEKLSEIVGGKIKYLKKEKDFAYITNTGQKHSSLNTATGIKSFGIIQMLLKSDLIDERSLLILDEPEVHLHPKWQIKYAELIIELVKNNINILVTSHSPYMIEALQRYSETSGITNDFYLAENEKIDKIENLNSETLAKIFEKLSEPFDIFEEMDNQKMEKFING